MYGCHHHQLNNYTVYNLHTATKLINNPEWFLLNQLCIERNVGIIFYNKSLQKKLFVAFQTSEPLSAIAM